MKASSKLRRMCKVINAAAALWVNAVSRGNIDILRIASHVIRRKRTLHWRHGGIYFITHKQLSRSSWPRATAKPNG